jgi:chloramphenicol O-acetyltransferase type A
MPLSVEAHHALIDGVHIGKYFQEFERGLAEPEHYFGRREHPVV